jgi:hypothetical protein
MREDLSVLDDLAAPDDWRAIERRTPASLPTEPVRTARRVVAAFTAIMVAIAAGVLLVSRFDRSTPLDETRTLAPSPAPLVQPAGAEGTLLFPEIDPKSYLDMQARADGEGHAPQYSLEPDALADRFIETVMGWYPVPDVNLETVPGGEHGETIARVTNPKSGFTATITLIQPVRTGEGGVWGVEAVSTGGATIDARPGQVVLDGSSIEGQIHVPEGEHAAWGFVVGDTNGEHPCFAAGGDTIDGTDISLVPRVPSDTSSGMDCGTEEGGYLWFGTRSFRVEAGGCGPLCGDSSPWGLVTIVPILVSLPQNQLAAGLSTYMSQVGWKFDYPERWSTSTTGNSVVLSNRDGSGAETVRLSISQLDAGLLDLADHDSSFPLDDADFTAGSGGERVAEYQGNGVRYRAALSVGADAVQADIDRMNSVVSSIRFPSIRGGEDSEIWHSLGARGYEDGIGTPAFLSDVDLGYLVRAPAGVYALGPNIESCGEGENTTWDASARQILFECPNGPDVRYELDGSPLPGNPPGYTDALYVYRVIVAWDGTFLVTLSQPIAVDPGPLWWR